MGIRNVVQETVNGIELQITRWMCSHDSRDRATLEKLPEGIADLSTESVFSIREWGRNRPRVIKGCAPAYDGCYLPERLPRKDPSTGLKERKNCPAALVLTQYPLPGLMTAAGA